MKVLSNQFKIVYILSFFLAILGLTILAICYRHNQTEKEKQVYKEMIEKENQKVKTIEFTNELIDKRR